MTKFFVSPIGGCPGTEEGIRRASISRRSTRTQNEWKVEITGLATLNPPTSFSTRSAISDEALLVKVTARIDSGITPIFSIRQAIRNVMTRVFPLPAPARMSTGPSVVSTASRCCGFNSSRNDTLKEFYRKGVWGGHCVGRAFLPAQKIPHKTDVPVSRKPPAERAMMTLYDSV